MTRKFQIQKSGNLLIKLSKRDRKELNETLANANLSYWSILSLLFEQTSCNGSYACFNAGDGNPFVGLNKAHCIAESMDIKDNGDCKIIGRYWYSRDYMVVNELEILGKDGKFEFKLA